MSGPFTEHSDCVRSVAFSPDSQWIVSSSDDGTNGVWNAMTGEIVTGPFIGHIIHLISVKFSPDGQQIVSSSLD